MTSHLVNNRLRRTSAGAWAGAAPGGLPSTRNRTCKSLGARINVRATPWFLTSFQTSSSGLISGEYGGRKNSRRRSFSPERKGKFQLKRIFRCHGIVDPSQLRPRQPLRTPARLAREAHPIRQHDRPPTTQIPWPGKDQAHAPPPLAAVQPALLHRLKADRFPNCAWLSLRPSIFTNRARAGCDAGQTMDRADFPKICVLGERTRELCLDFFAAVATLNSLRDASARLTSVSLHNVASNPPFYTVPHKSKIHFNFASFAMTVNQIGLAGRTRRRARAFNCSVWH